MTTLGIRRQTSRADRPAAHLWLLVGILLLAMALRFYRLDGQSLWADEGNSAALALRSLGQISRDAGRDIHPPLYYWLLHFWTAAMGSTEVGLRSLSAVAGVLLVTLTYTLGRRLGGRPVGLSAALIAALSPFQVYYSQEARMYMLLALLGALSIYSALRFLASSNRVWLAVCVLSSAAGLYTHYSFAYLWGLSNALWLAWTVIHRPQRLIRWIGLWALGQTVVVTLYAPWLPTAYRQLDAWPAISQAYGLRFYLHQAFRLWSLGESASRATDSFVFLWGMIVLWLLGAWPARRRGQADGDDSQLYRGLALAYCLVPVLLQWVISLYRPAYRPKFFLASTPAFAVLVGQGIVDGLHTRWEVLRRTWAVLGLAIVLIASYRSLGPYYFDPAWSRDDYRGVAAYIAAVERPGDAILLNAPGQWEVFTYYYHGQTPIYPLPRTRPPSREDVLARLEEIEAQHRRLFCLFWATGEADPDRIVESWLDEHAYKALDLWRGNVRFVTYALPTEAPSRSIGRRLAVRLGDRLLLQGYTLINDEVAAGEILQLVLFWQAEAPVQERYKVFVQLLDSSNNIVGQRDAEPGGGMRPTTLWPMGETIVDNYGVLIQPGTPPGPYRLITGLYSATTGQRLWAGQDDKVLLAQVNVSRPAASLPLETYGIQHPVRLAYDPLTILGYDVHKLGFDWRPEEPLRAGDTLHLNLYWRANKATDTRWRLNLRLVDGRDQTWWRGDQIPPSGQPYPTTLWQAGEIVRGQYNLAIPSHAPPGRYRLEGEVQPLGGGSALQPLWRSSWLDVGP